MSREDALSFLRELGLPEHIILHSISVAEKAVAIAKQIQNAGHHVNLDVVELGALLHDIGRIKVQGTPHAREGGLILRKHGFSDAIARIAETHSLGEAHPRTIEEKIVCYADKTTKGTQQLSIDARFELWIRRYGSNEFLQAAKDQVIAIEKELIALSGVQ